MQLKLYQDLEAYHAWANRKVLEQCSTLDQAALNATLPMGLGSAIATLQHMAGVERLWLDRWKGTSPNTMPTMPTTIPELEETFASLAHERMTWFESHPNVFLSSISYTFLNGEQNEQSLGELVLHVLNHAVHHRAQVVHFLKHQARVFPGGLDYIFYRIAKPTILLRPEIADGCRHWGLEVGTELEPYAAPDIESLVSYCKYGDWAMEQIFEQCEDMTDIQLDRDFAMGVGSLRKTLLHIYDAECFWQSNWQGVDAPFPTTPISTAISEMRDLWRAMSTKKMAFLARAGQEKLGIAVSVNFGNGPLEFRLSESILQLSVHGTLHRAQATNMIRSTGKSPKALDYVAWRRIIQN